LSYKFIVKSKKLLKKILTKIDSYNSDINEYEATGNIVAMPVLAFKNLAEDLYKAGRIKDAEKFLYAATNFPMNNSSALTELGIIKQKTGDIESAIECYKKAIKKDSKNIKIYSLLASALTTTKNFTEAEEVIQKAISINDKNFELYLAWGILLLKMKKYKEAKDKFNISAKYNFQDARSLYMSAVTEIELGEYSSAQEKLFLVVNLTENNFEAMHNLAYVYFIKKDYNNALKYAKQSLEIYQNKIETYLLLGDIYAELNDPENSFKTYENALQINTENYYLYLSYGNNLQKFHHFEKAIPILEKGLSLTENTPQADILSLLAKCYYNTNNIEQAEVFTQKAIDIASENHIAREVLGLIYYKKSDFKSAINEFLISIKHSEDKSNTYLLLARAYKKLDFSEEAETYLKKSLEYNPDNIDTITDYTNYLLEKNDYKLAITKLLNALKKFNNNEKLLNLLFLANYKLAKENFYKYNIEETLRIAKKIEEYYPNSFLYTTEKNELIEVLKEK